MWTCVLELQGLHVSQQQLTSRHDQRADAKLLVRQHALEGLALTFATPDAQDQRHLDLWQLHVVLRNVHCHLQGELLVVHLIEQQELCALRAGLNSAMTSEPQELVSLQLCTAELRKLRWQEVMH